MDYVAEIDKVLKDLQEITVVATYGNTKKLSNSMERLVALADELRKIKKEAAECKPEGD